MSDKTVYRECINWSNNDHCAVYKTNYCYPHCGKRRPGCQEKLADISTEIRQLSGSSQDGIITINGRVMADRIEAAEKREMSKIASKNGADFGQLGNAAAMREAVVLALSLLDLEEGVPYKTVSQKDIDFMKAALSAPPRNCDVYDKEEVRMAYHLHGDGLMTMQAVVDWLYSASKKRGDGSPRAKDEGEWE